MDDLIKRLYGLADEAVTANMEAQKQLLGILAALQEFQHVLQEMKEKLDEDQN